MKELLKTMKRNLVGLGASAVCLSAVPCAFAANDTDETSDKIVSSVINIMLKIFRYIGIILLAWSVGMLILAFKNEDADSKSRAIMLMVVSIILIALTTVLKPVLNSAGFNFVE